MFLSKHGTLKTCDELHISTSPTYDVRVKVSVPKHANVSRVCILVCILVCELTVFEYSVGCVCMLGAHHKTAVYPVHY